LGEEDELESRTTPLQEGEDDEDITPMDTNNTPQVDIQGPITHTRARQLNLQVISPMSHMESDLDVLYMDGKIISRSFQWNRYQDQIHPESTGIICTS
jgi:hypothetical protein